MTAYLIQSIIRAATDGIADFLRGGLLVFGLDGRSDAVSGTCFGTAELAAATA